MTSTLAAVEFDVPAVAPSNPYGLYAATVWPQAGSNGPARWLAGVQFRARNFSTGPFGIWGASWCADLADLTVDDIKDGAATEPDDPDPYAAHTAWAFERLRDCEDLDVMSRQEGVERVRQTFALREPIAVETEFATRALADAGTPDTAADLVAAVGHLEELLGATGTTGFIHGRMAWAAAAIQADVLVRDGDVLRTPLGHRWVFGGAYADVLGDTLVATSQPYGWRDDVAVREAIGHTARDFIAIAERSVVLGVEAVLGAVTVS